jgi:hypothetical protein
MRKHKLQKNKLQKGKLFRVKLSGDKIWELYLKNFKPEDNPVFRDPSSSEYNCNNCKNFIRRYGNVVGIVDNKIVSMFSVDYDQVPDEYKASLISKKAALASMSPEDLQKIKESLLAQVYILGFYSLLVRGNLYILIGRRSELNLNVKVRVLVETQKNY